MYPSSYLLRLVNNPYQLAFHGADDGINESKSENENDKVLEQCSDVDCELCSSIKANMPESDNKFQPQIQFDFNNNLLDSLEKYSKRKKRQLPEIPANKQPLASLIGSDSEKKRKITKQISANLSLQIELNENRKPISLQLINTDAEQFYESLERSRDDSRPLSEELNTNAPVQSPSKLSNKIEGNYRGLHKFIARHEDEISIEIGDSIYVIKQEDDLWFKGINLATNTTGYFPSLYVIDCNYNELFQTVNYFDSIDDDSGFNCECSNDYECNDLLDTGRQCFKVQKERFYLEFLGSLEVIKPKGDEVLEQCIRKVLQTYLENVDNDTEGQVTQFLCTFEIDNFGIRFRKLKPDENNDQPTKSIQKESPVLVINETEANDHFVNNEQVNNEEKFDEIDSRIMCEYDIIDIELKSEELPVKNKKSLAHSTSLENNHNRHVHQIDFKPDTKSKKQMASTPRQSTPVLSPEKQSTELWNEKLIKHVQSTGCFNPITKSDDDYFFDLKNITYCGSQENYFAFITKHPKLKQKYASHVFSTQSAQVSKMIEESIGKAFKRFYLNYIELSQNLVN